MTIEEYFGTLLQSVTEAHKKHLMTGKYSDHKALNEFYDEMPDLVDDLIEHWQGTHDKIENYKNTIEAEGKDPIQYLEELLKFTKEGQKEFFKDDSALSSDVDSIIGQIASTLYQLKDLKESQPMRPLVDYIKESFSKFAGRELAMNTLTNKFHLAVDKKHGKEETTIDGTTYEIKVHKMPFKDKCIIVDYNDLVTNTNTGLLFLNALTDFQDVCYLVSDRKALKALVDQHLERRKPGDWIWASKPDEKRLYAENNNFIGVTIKIDELLKEPWCSELQPTE